MKRTTRNQTIHRLTYLTKKSGRVPLSHNLLIDDEEMNELAIDTNEVCIASDGWVIPLTSLTANELSLIEMVI